LFFGFFTDTIHESPAYRQAIHGRMLIAVYVFELHLTTYALRFTVKEMLYALPAYRQAGD